MLPHRYASSTYDEGFDAYPFDQRAASNLQMPKAPSAKELPKLSFYTPPSQPPAAPLFIRPQLKDYINIPKLTNLYGTQQTIVATANGAICDEPTKISDFIQSNKSTTVDLTIKPNPLLLGHSTPPMEQSPLGLAETPELVQFYSGEAKTASKQVRSAKFFSFSPIRVESFLGSDEAAKQPTTEIGKEQLNTSDIQFGQVNFGQSLEPIFKEMDQITSAEPAHHQQQVITTTNETPQSKSKDHPRNILLDLAPILGVNPSTVSTTNIQLTSNSRNSATFRVSSGIGSTCGGSSARSSLSANNCGGLKLPQLPKANNNGPVEAVGVGAGMTGIAVWLKSLRLHKYTWLFANMNYEQMLQITEEYLERLGITKGARNKLAICITKLNQRYETLECIETGLLRGTCVTVSALDELSNIVQTPMKPAAASSKDVATKFLCVLNLGNVQHWFFILLSTNILFFVSLRSYNWTVTGKAGRSDDWKIDMGAGESDVQRRLHRTNWPIA